MSYLEIYNEQLLDLLSDAPGGGADSLAVVEDAGLGGASNVRCTRGDAPGLASRSRRAAAPMH